MYNSVCVNRWLWHNWIPYSYTFSLRTYAINAGDKMQEMCTGLYELYNMPILKKSIWWLQVTLRCQEAKCRVRYWRTLWFIWTTPLPARERLITQKCLKCTCRFEYPYLISIHTFIALIVNNHKQCHKFIIGACIFIHTFCINITTGRWSAFNCESI